ncbi:FAD-dependent monooxygenase [Actinoplanes sp. NPDC049265]|uniref:FAD-dependent monooxygenase n=1 Tax=Actinoplanes sp. NPDC049265 TaxID=3363902 RepID=UPI00371E3EF8
MPTASRLTSRTPVLLAGAGVSGSLTALELARHGVPSMVVERSGGPGRFPDLLLLSGRSMELLRRLGLNAELRAAGTDPARPVDIVWSTGLDRPPIVAWRMPPVAELWAAAGTGDGTTSIEPYLVISGPELSARLRRAVLDHPLIDLRTRWTLTDLRVETDTVLATVIAAESGARQIVEAAYLAGCDGADSTVRRCAGLALDPVGPAYPHLSVYFRNASLAGRWERPAAVITGDLTVVAGYDGDLCVAHLPLTAGAQAVLGDPAGLLARRLSPAGEPSEVVAVVERGGEPAVARSYRRGRVFLAGSAAHQAVLPGDDVDSCVGDAIDLGWRLAGAVRGWAGEAVLAEYAVERRGHALREREQAGRARRTRVELLSLAASEPDPEELAEAVRAWAPRLDLNRTGPADQAGRPGFRPPAFRLPGGEELFDRLGPQFTLVDSTSDQRGWPLVTAARERRLPVRHLPVAGVPTPPAWSGRLVLIQPGQRVAWCGDDLPADCDDVLDLVTGTRSRPLETQVYENT